MDYFIDLGQRMKGALKAQSAGEMFVEGDPLRHLLEKCGLPESRQNLEASVGQQLQFGEDYDADLLEKVKHRVLVIANQIMAEANKKQMIVLASHNVSKQLLALPKQRVLTDTQNRLLEETVRCLEVHAYRSAIVMGWNLAYDIIRQWIFVTHREDFNKRLATCYPKMSVTINEYEDWFQGAPSEFQVLEVCKENIITGRVNDRLVHYLRERNDCGHANFTDPTMERANAYIQNLLVIVTAKPFV